MHLRKLFVASLVALAVAVLGVASPASAKVITVRPGGSIQAAIDRAKSGDVIRVARGTYSEALVITKDRITLQGRKGTVLVPPAKPARCDPSDPTSLEGVCIHGDATFSNNAPPVVTRYVEGVNVTGFTVRGFPSSGIQVLAGRRTRIAYNKMEDNGQYGAFALVSSGTRMIRNTASGSEEAGLYVGDSPNARAVVLGNRVSGNTIGIFVRDAERGLIVANRVGGSCVGVVFLGDAPGPVGRFAVVGNRIKANNKFCPATSGEEGFRAVSGEGIDLFGANHVTIAGNKVLDNVPSGPSSGGPIGGGVNVVAGPMTPSSSNRVVGNQIRGNQPFDLFWDGAGSDNRFAGNDCGTSDPSGLC